MTGTNGGETGSASPTILEERHAATGASY